MKMALYHRLYKMSKIRLWTDTRVQIIFLVWQLRIHSGLLSWYDPLLFGFWGGPVPLFCTGVNGYSRGLDDRQLADNVSITSALLSANNVTGSLCYWTWTCVIATCVSPSQRDRALVLCQPHVQFNVCTHPCKAAKYTHCDGRGNDMKGIWTTTKKRLKLPLWFIPCGKTEWNMWKKTLQLATQLVIKKLFWQVNDGGRVASTGPAGCHICLYVNIAQFVQL